MPRKLGHHVRPGGLSIDDHERIFALAERGWKSWRIAKEIEKNPSTVAGFMYSRGLKTPRYARLTPSVRKGQIVKPFTPEEDDFVVAERLKGVGQTEIARLCTERFGHRRSVHTITMCLVMLASRDETEVQR